MLRGDIIKGFRIVSGITQNELAQKLNIDPAAIRKYENNVLTPKTTTLVDIARAFGVNPWILVTDWYPSEDKALYQLFSIFDLFGGQFELCSDGHYALRFTELDELISSWAQVYTDYNKKFPVFDKQSKFEDDDNLRSMREDSFAGYLEYIARFRYSDLSEDTSCYIDGNKNEFKRSIFNDLDSRLPDENSRLTFSAGIRWLLQDPLRVKKNNRKKKTNQSRPDEQTPALP